MLAERFLLENVPWSAYVAFRDALDDVSGVRMTYRDGALELMSPSGLHEEAKGLLARLLETWAVERGVDLRAFGSKTLRREAKKRGLEPDECYKLGHLDDESAPDIAIEVVVTKPLVDKLDVYVGLGVREVWVWRPGTKMIAVHQLAGAGYEVATKSAVLPDLDLAELATYVRPGENHTAAIRAYMVAIRAR
ncbi:MAG: Uma2 family endonuclease [Deltaproteobacteria bacterium]|nr:Uma2 family endonuclease [Deltaproteobacteria bacterium]